jgi:hypothetical protein
LRPLRDVDQANHHRDLDPGTDDRSKSSAAIDAEGRDSDRDGEFEIIGCRGERQGGGLRVVGANAALSAKERTNMITK